MDWKIGDVAVCVKVGVIDGSTDITKLPPLRLNAEYVIQNVYQCPKCKEISLDVGISVIQDEQNKGLGTQCCSEFIPCAEIHWCSALRFAKRKNKEEQLEEAIEKEDYERAGQLRDELNAKK
jgi:protein-arginine kinase activator protein McsA